MEFKKKYIYIRVYIVCFCEVSTLSRRLDFVQWDFLCVFFLVLELSTIGFHTDVDILECPDESWHCVCPPQVGPCFKSGLSKSKMSRGVVLCVFFLKY